jgi:peptidylamidoglycolate lyase
MPCALLSRRPAARLSLAAVACSTLVIACATTGSRSETGRSSSYQVVHGWPVLPDNDVLAEVSAVAVDSDENVFVLTRGNRKWPDSDVLDTTAIAASTVLVFEGSSGRMLSKWPNDLFALPHSITVDSHDNVWVTDVAWHQVFEFNHAGKLLLTLGSHGVPGNDESHFNRPSDVAVARDGTVYVSDGYENNRIVKFSPEGKFLKAWGTKGTRQGELNLPHALAVEGDKVFVVDRGNARIQIFGTNGSYIAQWPGTSFSSPQDIKIGGDGRALIASAGTEGPVDRTGIVILDASGNFVEKIGRFGNYDGQFMDLHWLALSKSGVLYTADFSGRRVQKFVRPRVR